MLKKMTQTQIKHAKVSLQLAGLGWLPDVLDLHAQIHEELPEEKKHSFMVRGMDYFLPLLDEAHKGAALMGVFDKYGLLIGMCSMTLQENWQSALGNDMLTSTNDVAHLIGATEKVAVLQSLCLTNAAKGTGLGTELIQSAMAWAYRQGANHVFAQVAHDNPCSWTQLMRQGFDLAASWTKGHGRYLLHETNKQTERQLQQSCIAAKEEFYVGAAAHDDWVSLFEDHLAQKGRIAYHQAEKKSKLLRFDFTVSTHA